MKTAWDLRIFYNSKRDPRIKRDFNKLTSAYTAFAKKYQQQKQYLRKEKALLKALQDYEKLSTLGESAPVLLYLFLTRELDTEDSEAHALLTKLSTELTTFSNKILFFELELSKLPLVQQRKFLKSKLLAPHRYQLECLFKEGKYFLSEAEEKILNLKSLPSYELWVDGVEKVLNKQVVSFGKEQLPLPKAQNMIPNLPTKKRRELHAKTMECLKLVSDFAESEINAVVLNKKIGDELRGYKEPYSATIQSYENDEKSVLNLVKVVTDNFSISHRFYRLKAKLHKLSELTYADRSASVGSVKRKFSFKDSAKLFEEVLATLDPLYVNIFKRFLDKGQIDVYPKKGKSRGAYCLGSIGNPTFVLLNHTDSFNSFTTLAHEMGHAIHTELAKAQPPRYQGYTTSVAETASTLFEALAFEHLFENLSKREQIIALHDKLSGDISTVFRQIAFFNFELDLHKSIRAEGSLSKEVIARLLNKHMDGYLGPSVKLTDDDGYFFVAVSHFRRFFYVYSYAYGQLISKVMAQRFVADRSYSKQIKEFLTLGNSKSPIDIFKQIGIDTTRPNFFAKGLQSIEQDIVRLENLIDG
jgi:oligoendopeptidase F